MLEGLVDILESINDMCLGSVKIITATKLNTNTT